MRALALVAEVMHGTPCRFTDPARFSIAHGGKDRHPYAVPIKVYDETIGVLKSAVQKAKLGREEELAALKRLDDQARRLELTAGGLNSYPPYWRRNGITLQTTVAAACSVGRNSQRLRMFLIPQNVTGTP